MMQGIYKFLSLSKNKNGEFNKYNNYGVTNRSKPKNIDRILAAQFEKFKYGMISKEQRTTEPNMN